MGWGTIWVLTIAKWLTTFYLGNEHPASRLAWNLQKEAKTRDKGTKHLGGSSALILELVPHLPSFKENHKEKTKKKVEPRHPSQPVGFVPIRPFDCLCARGSGMKQWSMKLKCDPSYPTFWVVVVFLGDSHKMSRGSSVSLQINPKKG